MSVKKRPVSPRQKMINLMYIVLMAMLALNVSSDVLNAFSLIEDSLSRSTANSMKENASIYDDFAAQLKGNPAKVQAWYNKAHAVKQMSDSLYNYAEQLKWAIVRDADGRDGNIRNIENKDNLEAAGHIMLAPVRGQGHKLFLAINSFRERITALIPDARERSIISANLSTAVPRNANATLGKNWEEYMFEQVPVAAAVTMLTKLQNDVRNAEGQALHSLIANIDMKDVRVNELAAYVIPEATTLYPGEQFKSRIIMAAIDTTKRPEIFVNGRRISSDGNYSFSVGGAGEYSFSGYIQMPNASGEIIRRPFTQKYNVIAPPTGAAVAADLMNVLYAGYNNPITVSASGIPSNKIHVSMSGGSLSPRGMNKFIARPGAVGHPVTFTVSGEVGGKTQNMGVFTFQVRKLPDPIAFVISGDDRFKGGRMAKGSIIGSPGIGAAIDDGLLNIPFKVVGFETIFFDQMGNARPETVSGSSFSENQRNLIRSLRRGQRFFIGNVRVVGPDGISRTLVQGPQIIVN